MRRLTDWLSDHRRLHHTNLPVVKKRRKKIFPLSASSWGRSLGITVRKKRKEMKLLFFYFTLFGFVCFLPELTGKSCIVLCVVGVLSKLNLPFVMSLKGSDSFHLMSTTQTDKASVWAGGHKQRDKYAGHLHFCFVFLCVCVFVFQNLFSVVKVLLREQTYCCNQTFFFFCPVFFDLKFKNHLKSWINLFFISIWQTTPDTF